MAARKARAGSRPEAKPGWAPRRLTRGDSRDGDRAVTLQGSTATSTGGSGVLEKETALQVSS